MTEYLKLAPEVSMAWYACAVHGPRGGLHIWFGTPRGDDSCVGKVPICGCHGKSSWLMLSDDPLTVSPSIWVHCHRHESGHHGFITEGKWIPA
jgi:hypothetical protein